MFIFNGNILCNSAFFLYFVVQILSFSSGLQVQSWSSLGARWKFPNSHGELPGLANVYITRTGKIHHAING